MNDERLQRAREALEGLSVGDALGDQFFMHADIALSMIGNRALPKEPWRYTDDTNMALSIYQILRQYGEISQDALASSFAKHYHASRGYGPAMHRVMEQINEGIPWQQVAGNLFDGQGSYGNGAAMRVAPLGAYFADDLDKVVEQARLSAEITHSHPEAIAGAIAIAIATAYAWLFQDMNHLPDRHEFLNQVLKHIPDSEVKSGIRRARDLSPTTTVDHAAAILGNGYKVTAQDTVPFALWSAANFLDQYEEAFWNTVSVLGDRDTNCAIVGAIVAATTGINPFPVADWITMREPLPGWAFED